jgi:spheroidene monooxygenase
VTPDRRATPGSATAVALRGAMENAAVREAAGARARAVTVDDGGPATVDHVAVLLLADMARGSRLWGALRIVRGPGALRGEPGLRFAKVLGSGAGGGFGLKPSPSHQGVFALFDGEHAARAFVETSATIEAYRAHARELCVLLLRACSSRGAWSGQTVAVTAAAPVSGPIVALTRASIRPARAARFLRMAPPAQAALAQAPGCLLAAGLGEAPLLRQATVSAWDSVAAMDAYARSGAHGQAIRAAAQGGFFSESMFVRFAPLRIEGTWLGRTHAWRGEAAAPAAREAQPAQGVVAHG